MADFLCFLRKEKKLAPSTIEGYRTAISHVVKAVTHVDLGKDPSSSKLMMSFAKEAPLRKSSVPPCDLSLVLLMLTKARFEPLLLADLKFVTWKTVFLIALASGRCCSELHALQADIQHAENWADVTIFTDPQFIAKTQLIGTGGRAMKPLTIKALSKVLSPDLTEDRSLCVVRVLKYYLQRTKDVRSGRKQLFIAHRKGH